MVLHRPAVNLFGCAIGSAVAIRPTAIPFLKELPVLALELVVEDDTADARALAAQTLGSLQVGAIDLGVVGQFARLPEARVEPLMFAAGLGLLTVSARPSVVEFAPRRGQVSFLPRTNRRAVMTLENVSTFLRQDDEGAVASGTGSDLHEAGFLEVAEVARTRVERTFLSVMQIASRHDAKRSDDGERPRLRAAQRDVTATCPDAVAFGTARQVEVPHEHVARVEGGSIARIRHAAATALVELATVIPVARIVVPTWIVHLASPSKTAANTGLSCCPTETPTQFRASPRNHLERPQPGLARFDRWLQSTSPPDSPQPVAVPHREG
jgi:hypothetical protein